MSPAAVYAPTSARRGRQARLGLAALIALITVIGGRIVPAFTANWLAARQTPAVRLGPGVDRLALAVTGVTLVA